MNLICTSHPKRDGADYVCCPSLLKKECLTEIFLVTDFWGMGKDHFSDYFKIHDEIHLRYTEFVFQNLTFWKKKSFYFGWRISWWNMYTHDRSCAHSRLAVSFTILTLQNILKMHFTVKYLKFWTKNI